MTEIARRPRGDGCDLVVTRRFFNTTITVVDDEERDDATTGDVFLQCVCFGEAIYG